MIKSNLKIPLREQAKASNYIKTYGHRTKIFLREPLITKDYAEGKVSLDPQGVQGLDLQEIAIQLSESVQELLALFDDVHRRVADTLGYLRVPGPGNEEHMKYKLDLTGKSLVEIMCRYEDFKYKRGLNEH